MAMRLRSAKIETVKFKREIASIPNPGNLDKIDKIRNDIYNEVENELQAFGVELHKAATTTASSERK